MKEYAKQKGTVSIVMCTYNGEQYIREQLDSIVSQTYPIYELIIQDDKSTDSTISIIQEYVDRYTYIRLYQNDRNLGFNNNFKSAIMKAVGEFIAISDQDDIWFPEKIAKQIEVIGEKDICFSSYYRGTEFTEQTPVISPLYNMERLIFSNCIPGHSMLIRQSFIRLPHVWNEHICYDWWFLICAHLNNGIAKIDIPLNWHRTHPESAIATIHRKYALRVTSHPTYQPYLYGIYHLYRLKKKETWQGFYSFVYHHTNASLFTLPHKISQLLLQKNPFALIHLCLLCMKYREKIYPNPFIKGITAYIRGLFYPFIYAYNNTDFEL